MEQRDILKKHVIEYQEKLNMLLDSMDIDILNDIVETIVEAFRNDKTLYICGNV